MFMYIRAVRWRRVIPVLVLLLLLVGGLIVAARLGLLRRPDAKGARDLIEAFRHLPHVRLSFVAVYALAAAAGVPATGLVIAGGVLFGPVVGMILNYVADMLAAVLGFSLVRVMKGSVLPVPSGRAAAPLRRGFSGLLRLRLIPVVPFALLNFGAAAYGLEWRSYLAATAIGIIPTTVVYTMFAASLAAGAETSSRRAFLTAAVLGVVGVALSLLPRLVRRRRSEPNRAE